MKNILFVVENYYPRMSGVPVVVRYLAEGLNNKGYHVCVATKLYEGLSRHENVNNIDVHRFKLTKTQMKFYRGEIEEYRRFVTDSDFDCVIFECSECVTTDVLLPVLNKIKGKKIFHSHGFAGMTLPMFKWNVNLKYSLGNTYNWFRFKYYYLFTFKQAIKKFDEALCLSAVDSSKNWLEKNARHLTILQNAVDDVFCLPTQPVRFQPISSLKDGYLLGVCTYSKQKNQIGIIREYYKADIDIPLVFIGPQKNEYYDLIQQEMERLTKAYGPKPIYTFVGVSREYIPDIIGNALIYLVGSTFEEYSISLIETMSKGVPFISTNVGNARMLPGGITIDSINDMHKAILNLIDSEKTRKNLGGRGIQFVNENCRRQKAVDLIESIINK